MIETKTSFEFWNFTPVNYQSRDIYIYIFIYIYIWIKLNKQENMSTVHSIQNLLYQSSNMLRTEQLLQYIFTETLILVSCYKFNF